MPRIAVIVAVFAVAGARTTQADGTLVIHGGGRLTHEVVAKFVELGGGADGTLVVIPTAAADVSHADELAASWRKAGFGTALVLHTRSRDRANADDFVAPLATATAVWFDGGDQSRLERAYTGTRVETELHALLDRGGVIGGASAGAAIMSKVMIRGGTTSPRMGTGLDLIPGVIIDQHFLARHHEPRLRRALRKHRRLIGIGIDEGTALIVHGNDLTVVGESTVTVERGGTATVLASGDTADLAALRAIDR